MRPKRSLEGTASEPESILPTSHIRGSNSHIRGSKHLSVNLCDFGGCVLLLAVFFVIKSTWENTGGIDSVPTGDIVGEIPSL